MTVFPSIFNLFNNKDYPRMFVMWVPLIIVTHLSDRVGVTFFVSHWGSRGDKLLCCIVVEGSTQ